MESIGGLEAIGRFDGIDGAVFGTSEECIHNAVGACFADNAELSNRQIDNLQLARGQLQYQKQSRH